MTVTRRLFRHVEACRNAVLPGGRLPVRLGGQVIGWIAPMHAALLGLTHESGFADATALSDAAATLAARGVFKPRGEAFDVRSAPGGPTLGRIDRGALPVFGLLAEGVHVNGLVGDRLWVGRRAPDKALDPGKLDHLVAGGIPAGLDAAATLRKEGAEEAALPEALAAQAKPVARIAYAMQRPEGLRRDVLHCYDLDLPEDFVPRGVDGEVVEFALWPLARVLERLAETDDFKFNVTLVLIDLLLRRGLIDAHSDDGRALAGAVRR